MTTQHLPTTKPWHVPGPADIVEWRASRLRDGGFPADLAQVLARQAVDLHALLQLVDAGCRPDLAARILSPQEDPGPSR
jgi:hypothetical protein